MACCSNGGQLDPGVKTSASVGPEPAADDSSRGHVRQVSEVSEQDRGLALEASLAAAMGAKSPGDLSERDKGEVLTVVQLDLSG